MEGTQLIKVSYFSNIYVYLHYFSPNFQSAESMDVMVSISHWLNSFEHADEVDRELGEFSLEKTRSTLVHFFVKAIRREGKKGMMRKWMGKTRGDQIGVLLRELDEEHRRQCSTSLWWPLKREARMSTNGWGDGWRPFSAAKS